MTTQDNLRAIVSAPDPAEGLDPGQFQGLIDNLRAMRAQEINRAAMMLIGQEVEQTLPLIAPANWHADGTSDESLLVQLETAKDAGKWAEVAAISALLLARDSLN